MSSELAVSRLECGTQRSHVLDLEHQVEVVTAEKYALSLAPASDKAALEVALRPFTFFASEQDVG